MKRTIVSLVAVTALSLAGCGGSEDAPASSDDTSQSSSESASESSGQESDSDDKGGSDDSPDVLDTSRLLEGAELTSYRMSVEAVSSEGDKIRATAEVVANPASATGHDTHVVAEMSGDEAVEVMIIGGDYYVKLSTPIEGKTWVKGPIPTDASDVGLGVDTLNEMVTELVGSNSLTKVGREDGLVKYGHEETYVWVDGNGRLAKIEGGNANGKGVVTFSDWGGDFTITPPPASEVVEQP